MVKQTTCELAKAHAATLRLRGKEKRSLAGMIQFLHSTNANITINFPVQYFEKYAQVQI